jgi:hypothetical protein
VRFRVVHFTNAAVRIRPGGWTVFDVRVVNGLDFWLEPSEGTPYEITTPRRVP